MPYLRALIIVACVLILPACVSTKTVPLGESDSSLASKSIILAKHPMPDFTLMTRGSSVGMLFGAIGGAAAGAAGGSSGNKIIADNQIADPAASLGDILLKEIVAKYHLSPAAGPAAVVATQKPEEIAKLYPGSDLVLDVETVYWGAAPYPTVFSPYVVSYIVKVNVIDTKSGKAIAEAYCPRSPAKDTDHMSYDEMLANSAIRLKTSITTASQSCLDELRSKLKSSAANPAVKLP